jgi:ferredoxin
MATSVNPEKCTGCEECVESCPLDAITVKDGVASIDPETCGDCGACVDTCPSEAISL